MPSDRILVTGLGGLIGNAVARRLVAEGRAIVGADRAPPPQLPCPFEAHELCDAHRLHEIVRKHSVRQIVHAGGISGPMVLPGNPARVAALNVMGLVDVLEVMRIAALDRLVWFSTVNVYAESTDTAPVTEQAARRPVTVYGASKLAGEGLLAAYAAEHGVDGVALRVSSTYGPGRTSACFIRLLIENAARGMATRVPDANARVRQHIFVEDVAAATIAALDRRRLPQLAYNIAPGRASSTAEVAAEVAVAVPGARIEIAADGMPWNAFRLGPLDIAAARRDLAWTPRVSLEQGAGFYAEWLGQQRKGASA
jgi:UDP-glucose 4-epimerase